MTTAVVALLAVAAPAGAVVTEVTGTTVGLQPRNEGSVLPGYVPANNGHGEIYNEAETLANPAGNPVLHSSDVYAIYWDPTDVYHKEWQRLIDVFLNNVGTDSGSLDAIFAVDSQYTDRTNKPASYDLTFRGSYADTDAYPKAGCTDPAPLEAGDAITCITNSQVQEELKVFIADHKLATGMGSVFYLLTPPGVTVCLDGAATHCSDYAGEPEEASYNKSFCSYHSDINPDNVATGDASTILYGVIPWTAGGRGNWHLTNHDRKQNAVDCQDGGFDPSTKPAEKKEHPKELNKTEIEAREKMSTEELEKSEIVRALEGPHPEEPNQILGFPGEDGAYDTGLADLIINQVAVEQEDIVTDPLLNAWQDALHNEVTDECRNDFLQGTLVGSSVANELTEAGTLSNQLIGGGSYYLNMAFSLASLKLGVGDATCTPGVNLIPQFTSPTPVNAGDIVGFDGMESDVSLDTRTVFSSTGTPEKSYATYSWNFGDGTPEVTGYAPGSPSLNSPETSPCEQPWLAPCAGSTYHAYQYGGEYKVTLTITDVGGNKASVTHTVTVIGPPKPVENGGGSSGAGGGSGGSGGSSGSSTTGSTSSGGATSKTPVASPVPAPVAAAAIVSRTLQSATRKGLVVRYSVNEQVAGHFEVLLSRAIASRLGIGGPAVSGLPAGTPPEVMIARATLVTTKGGNSAVHIQFSKRTAARLRRLHKVSLTLLLAVRNSSPESPTSTTVITTTTLVA